MSTTTATPERQSGERQSGRHPVNVGHLVMGIAFLAIVGVWALIQSGVVDNDDIRWLLPVPWVLAGLGGLLALALSSRRKWSTSTSTPAGWTEPAETVASTESLEENRSTSTPTAHSPAAGMTG